MQNKKVELLAPAGNPEAFYGAIHAGADAVYLGGSRFGARAYADNFTEEELISCIRYAHIFGRRVYLTVNTLVKEEELSQLYDYLAPFYAAGLDGVIIQDIGVFNCIREAFPDMELHVSTQMTITGKYGASLLKEMGACRVVPARELCLEEIRELKKVCDMELECFIHGAMCYCYSGQCLFSSILGGRSGNRGRCAQPCRLPYTVRDGRHVTGECYPLSLKDMCTIEMLPELMEAGIDSFKIEGRMKKPEYAAGVTSIYRKYIDRYYEQQSATKKENFQVEKADLEKLSRLYIRSERQDGYYHKHNGRDMVTLDSPAYSGSDDALLEDIRKRYLEKKATLPVSIYGYFQTGEQAYVTFVEGDLSVTVTGEVVQKADRQPVSIENIRKQLTKLGGSAFIPESVEIFAAENAFYSLKAINELRREAVKRLEELRISSQGLCVSRKLSPQAEKELTGALKKQISEQTFSRKDNSCHGQLHISVRTLEQLRAILEAEPVDVERLYVNGDLLFDKTAQPLMSLLQQYQHLFTDMELIIAMPYILRRQDETYMEKLLEAAVTAPAIWKGFRISSLEGLGFLQKKKYSGKIYGDYNFYMWNRKTIDSWEQLDGFCLPLELRAAEQKALLTKDLPCEKLFYGKIPMMLTANCVAKTTTGCKKGGAASEMVLTDRYQKNFPVLLNCTHCMNIIYNTLPLSLHRELAKWKNQTALRLDFTLEDGKAVLEVLTFFRKLIRGECVGNDCIPPYPEYTTGHEKRGVE